MEPSTSGFHRCGVGSEAVTKTMKVTGPRKLQRKPLAWSNQQLGEKGGVWSAPSKPRGRGHRRAGALCLGAASTPWPSPTTSHSLLGAAVALALDGCRDGHDEQRHAVADQAQPALSQALALEHAHHEEVELHALEAHPAEGGQEAVVQHRGHQAAAQPNLRGGGGAEGQVTSAMGGPDAGWQAESGRGLAGFKAGDWAGPWASRARPPDPAGSGWGYSTQGPRR